MRRGFTLIELLVAMAILAVVSIMGVQALSGVFFQREILTRTDVQAVAVIRTLSLLRQDFEAVVPLPATLEETELGLALGDNRITLARGGLAEVPGDGALAVAVVEWRVEGGALVRGEQGGPARQMLEGVRGLSVVQIGREDGDESTGLPPGLRVTIETDRWGALDVVVVR
ncbi:PulJ/GspJ family protein [Pararhodobacter zhoushanensis]|uniref:PulJ/GspJ family protein n=1 Tax=Pararhodobacter zhoushanensis TaxID=2479545 RepID=UPI000F8E909F|nr:prepilin-type N-terminal cleavage/methylation domain-containing protein [Pararhodobacter zhoushanensis]